MAKIVTDEEQRLIHVLRQRIGEAFAEIEPRPVAAAATKVSVRITGDPGLTLRNWFDSEQKSLDQRVKLPAGEWILQPVNNHRSLKVARG